MKNHIGFLLAALAAGTAHAATPTVPSDVRSAVQRRVGYGYTPGITIGMVNASGRTVWSHGTRSWDDTTQPDGSTLYEIASVTKTFTAILLAQMEAAGDVAFDDLVSAYLPPGTSMPPGGGERITLEHLGAHRSGLPTITSFPACVAIDPANPFARHSTDWLYNFLPSVELSSPPGTTFLYSNTGIGLLGHALALSQSTSYESLLSERVLAPLGMADTAITLTPEQETRRAPGHAGYVVRPRFEMGILSPAGALFSTADDLLTYLEHNIGLVPESPLAGAMAETHRSRGPQPPIDNISMQAGLAWWTWDLGGGVVQHGGDSPGTAAFLGFRPSTGTGVVVLSNARRHANSQVRDLGMRCLGASAGVSPTNRPATVSLAEKQSYIGRYEFMAEEIAIGMLHGELTLFSNGTEVTLYPKASRRFSYLDAGGSAEFNFSADGTRLTVQQGRNIRFDRVTGPPRLKINRDCDDIVVRLLGEPGQNYLLQTSPDGRHWTDLAPWSLRHPPHREPTTSTSRLFRAIPTTP